METTTSIYCLPVSSLNGQKKKQKAGENRTIREQDQLDTNGISPFFILSVPSCLLLALGEKACISFGNHCVFVPLSPSLSLILLIDCSFPLLLSPVLPLCFFLDISLRISSSVCFSISLLSFHLLMHHPLRLSFSWVQLTPLHHQTLP